MESTESSVRISSSYRQLDPGDHSHAEPLRLPKPIVWLGAQCPFGLALPPAMPSDVQMYGPRGVWMDSDRLIVCDSGNHRVLIWNSIPSVNHQPADIVLGQPDFQNEGPAAGGRSPANGLFLPTGIEVVQGKLVIADAWHHRILVWHRIPDRSDVAPDFAIGQSDMLSVAVNRGGSASRCSLNWPFGIAWHEGRFWVADTGNRRVLVWNEFPNADTPADRVLGQPDFESAEENRGGSVSNQSFRWPHAITFFGEDVLIADAGNHRVLGWHGTVDEDRPADFVLGQSDFSMSAESPYLAQGARRLRFPYGIAVDRRCLAVADTANNRIVFYRLPIEKVVGDAAIDVIGQIDFGSNGENRWIAVTQETLCWPYGLAFHDGVLAVADSGNNRVMLWDCRELVNRLDEGIIRCV